MAVYLAIDGWLDLSHAAKLLPKRAVPSVMIEAPDCTPPMHRHDLSSLSFALTAANVARVASLDAAYDLVRQDIFKQLLALSCVLEWTGDRWTARTDESPESAMVDFAARRSSSPASSLNFSVHHGPLGTATIVPLSGADGPRVVLAIEGDWSHLREPLSDGAMLLSLALQVVRERATRLEAARLLVDGYAMIRRLSRLGSVEAVAGGVVKHVADLLDAERVSLALYREDEASLTIVAAEGFPLTSVKDVRILPGDWVMGHVFASRRPVIVPDVRLLPGLRANPARYRTFSFAAVPMLAGCEVVGVITVTDKRSNAAFTRQDELVLRTLSAAAAVALVAARSGNEVTRLAYAATIDSLTGLLNRPGFDARLHQELERTKRETGDLAVLMADVDEFKTINDTRGHQVGDAVLRRVGSVIRSSVRVFDVCARYGGDEFAVVMPNSDRQSAILCAERIRQRLADRAVDDDLPALTMSIGVAIIAPGDNAGDLILRADQCLYVAKADGKNLVRAEPQQPLHSILDERGHRGSDARVVNIRQGRDEAPGNAETTSVGGAELRYVLVVDSVPERVRACLEAVAPFLVGFLVARDGAQARGIIERFGPPLLLVVDLALPSTDGFELIEFLRSRDHGRGEVIAWCASREMREYASARLSRQAVHVLASSAAGSTIRAAVDHSLERKVVASPPPAPAAHWDAEELQRVMSELAYRTKQLVNTPGVAVYMHGPGDRAYRASFSWNSENLMPHSPYHLPRAFEEIAASGQAVITRDLAIVPNAAGIEARDGVRGLAGFPVVGNGEILGALCVFDVLPLAIADDQISALEALARSAVEALNLGRADDRLPSRAASVAELVEQRSVATVVASPLDWPPALLERVGGEFAVARELARARREGKELSVVLFEIAPLTEETNLDESVQYASETLLKAIRQSDLPIRWSGREFLVVLPGLTGSSARTVAERVRAALQAGARHQVAVSGGVAELGDEEGFGEVVSRARERVSLACGRGHNRVL